jgi:hypothetical protein
MSVSSLADRPRRGGDKPSEADVPPLAPVPAPEPRVIDASSRIRPGYAEQEMHRRLAAMNLRQPPKTMGRLDSDFPAERERGWKRYRCRGIDEVNQNGFRVRETIWPVLYILAPDVQSAEQVYRRSIAPEREAVKRNEQEVAVAIKELDD